MQNVQVSVIIVVYNAERYIKQTVESILMQKTTFPFEIIVGDDASTDHTSQVLQQYMDLENVEIIIREKNIGACANYWDCIKKSKGKYIAGVDGDDFWTDEHVLQKEWEFLKKCPQYLAVGHHRIRVDEDNNYLGDETDVTLEDYVVTMRDVMRDKKGYSCSTLYFSRESLIDSSLGTEDLLKLDRNQGDKVINHIILSQGNIFILKDICSAHRVYLKNQGSNFNSLFSEYQKFLSRVNIDLGLEKYFQGRYSYTMKIARDTVGYIFYCFRFHEKLPLKKMYRLMGFKRLFVSMLYFPIYAVQRVMKKLLNKN